MKFFLLIIFCFIFFSEISYAKAFTFYNSKENPRRPNPETGDCGGFVLKLNLKGNKFVTGQGIELEGNCDKEQIDLPYLDHNEKTGAVELAYVDGGHGNYKLCKGIYYFQKLTLNLFCLPAKKVKDKFEYNGSWKTTHELVVISIK